MQSRAQLGRSSSTCSCSFRAAAGTGQLHRTGISSGRRQQRRQLQVCNKFSNPFEGMFGGSKGGDADAARKAIEVGDTANSILTSGSSSWSQQCIAGSYKNTLSMLLTGTGPNVSGL